MGEESWTHSNCRARDNQWRHLSLSVTYAFSRHSGGRMCPGSASRRCVITLHIVLRPVKVHISSSTYTSFSLASLSLGSGAQEADVPRISDALCFARATFIDVPTQAPVPPNCTSCAFPGVVFKNASCTQVCRCH